jgi:hypothetical protein
MVDSASGTVRMSDLAEDRCTSTVLDGHAGATFGPSVESGGFAYVPIFSTGEVVVIRVAEGTLVNRYLVTAADHPFELTVKDGTVWFNEPDGARAGVLGAEGVRTVDKYNQQVEVSDETAGGQPAPGSTSGSSGEGEQRHRARRR